MSLSTLTSFVSCLSKELSDTTKIFSDPNNTEFNALLLRWSDINKQIPGAIVLVGTVDDVVASVRIAVEMGIPFVPKSGGHSLWSTIGSEGFILDLSQLQELTIDKNTNTVTLQSDVLVKQANDAAWSEGLCLRAQLSPFGGLNAMSSLCGYMSDNILAAKMVSAKGHLITLSPSSYPELLYAIRGAGQFFGVVVEITLQAYPSSILKMSDRTVWTGMMLFQISQAEEVFNALIPLTENNTVPAAGLCLITSAPPMFDTMCIVVLPTYFGPTSDAEKFFAPLLALRPFSTCNSIPYSKVNDAADAFCVKGGFKCLTGAATPNLDPDVWMKVIDHYEALKLKCPNAALTCYAVEWTAYLPEGEHHTDETAFSHRDIKIWAELLSWYTDSKSHEEVNNAEKDVFELVHGTQTAEERATYPNWSRDDPIESRYRDANRLVKLKALKEEWDPQGIFTRQLL
ncbi:hypothetical protein M422DRAFT_59649 [Sphaerobolus stellatus SS14]|uniref:FAD-binding PCMH-type domain-containing protein n=1 Tax=Sphaerobolus stellatus (strain SS14) TaxID=990650 RepID=A0A0C9VG93_SPHS4|nr:hypothetical protein M422DRAFT_59649 [Sphaerobolus stellatus SS14]